MFIGVIENYNFSKKYINNKKTFSTTKWNINYNIRLHIYIK